MFHTFQKKYTLLLCVIVFVAALLRFYQLGSLPPSLTWDEVSLGYNAYSLSMDGKDEFGRFLPYDYLESFGDFKPPVYSYLTILPISLFGLTEFAVRFPSAFFGTLTVLVTYFLVKQLFFASPKAEWYALASAGIMALSPWHIMLSRAAFEANVATFFVITGVWLFLLAIQRKPFFLILSTICFIASMYTFNSARIVAPVLFICLLIGHFKTIWKIKKFAFISFFTSIVLLLPIMTFLLSPEAKLRYNEVNIFSDISIVETANQEIANDNNAWWSKIIHNRRIAYTREYLYHYFDHFNPSFLFVSGDINPKFSTHDVGQMYLWDLPFFVLGILFLFRKREKNWWIIPLWLLIGILPAAAARETPHALRIESSLPTWQIITAYGFITVLLLVKRYRRIFATAAASVLFLFVLYYLHGYYTHYAKEYSLEWQYAYKDAITYVKENQGNYKNVHISNKLERPYIYTLFYLKYDPQKFREEATVRRGDFGFVHIDKFGKYSFGDDPEKLAAKDSKTLYIAGIKQVPIDAKVLKEFHVLNGKTILVAYTKKL